MTSDKVSLVVTKSRPLGQGIGPARPAECTARPSARAVEMVGETTAVVAHSRPGGGSTVAHLEAQCARGSNLLPAGRENVTFRPVYGRLVTFR